MEEIEYDKEDREMEHNDRSALSTIIKGANLAATAFAVLRHFDPHIDTRSLLRWVGISRRRSFWGSAALFGAGAVAGAGIALFVSPRSGRETRQGMMRGVRSIGEKGRALLQQAGSEISQATQSLGLGQGEESEQQGGQSAQQGHQGGKEQDRPQGGKEQGAQQQGRQQGGKEQGEKGGEAPRAGMTGQENIPGNGNRAEGGKSLHR